MQKVMTQMFCKTFVQLSNTYGLFGWREEEGEMKESRVELAKNKLILC